MQQISIEQLRQILQQQAAHAANARQNRVIDITKEVEVGPPPWVKKEESSKIPSQT